jgi:hypothetical protein
VNIRGKEGECRDSITEEKRRKKEREEVAKKCWKKTTRKQLKVSLKTSFRKDIGMSLIKERKIRGVEVIWSAL